MEPFARSHATALAGPGLATQELGGRLSNAPVAPWISTIASFPTSVKTSQPTTARSLDCAFLADHSAAMSIDRTIGNGMNTRTAELRSPTRPSSRSAVHSLPMVGPVIVTAML